MLQFYTTKSTLRNTMQRHCSILRCAENVFQIDLKGGNLFMTSNQIAYWNMLETRRANLERERNNRDITYETVRHNKVFEGETHRHNRSEESIGWGNLQETSRHNVAYENETRRHNITGERQNRFALNESKRHNIVSERQNQQSINENQRHNIMTENLSRYNYDLQHFDRQYSANLNYDSNKYRTDKNANISKYATDRKYETDMYNFIGKYPKTALAIGLINNRKEIARGAAQIWTKYQNMHSKNTKVMYQPTGNGRFGRRGGWDR